MIETETEIQIKKVEIFVIYQEEITNSCEATTVEVGTKVANMIDRGLQSGNRDKRTLIKGNARVNGRMC